MPKTALGTKKSAAVRKTMRGKIGNASKTSETTPNKGSTLRQVSPLASRMMPRVVGEGNRSATRPPT